jgi:polyhydroxyalkanoate synthesis regulator phasin
MKKLIASISIITALGVGAFALNSVLPAGAASNSATQAADPGPNCGGGPRAKFKGVLDGLVQKGTITQAQEDAIVQAFKDAAPADKPGRGGRGGPRMKILQDALTVVADKIGVSVDDLKSALKSGKSIADVANEHNVAPADVVKAIVDAGTGKIDQAVTDGKLTQAQADKLKAHLPEMADKLVNHTRPNC